MSARFVLSRSIALEKYRKLRELGLTVAYSVKTNPLVAELLERETDALFVMHPMEDLGLIRDPQRVWYYGQGWDAKEIDSLVSRGVTRFVVDNTADLAALEGFLGSSSHHISLLLRARFREHSVFTGRHYVFGMDSATVRRKIAELQGHPAIEALGVHVHRKSQNISEWSLVEELKGILDDEAGIQLLNIGGGIPARYANSSDDALEGIFRKLREVVAFAKERDIKVIAEPGRFIAAPSVVLETTVKRVVGDTVILDCSVYNSAMDSLIVPLKLAVDGELSEGKAYTLKGCTPCSMDLFRYAVRLARPPKEGETIRFLNAGAYNFASDFCGLRKLETVIVG